MTLGKGTQFGVYQITDPLGVGGMGEVYRATDMNLKREVAIKVLPESFAQDADRLARFQREAEVLASLNHVNIATIHGLERSAGVTALVMELVEGPTLAERLEHGPIPVDEALGIAMQIAEALEAAHERGIVHRDLKPANIKLRPDGAVKVLDFGIAKALDTHGNTAAQAAQLTTPAMTEAGVILGTAAYMSPEQARGKKVDQRADIWAFGCVLYEMLTGQPAFGAEDVTTTLARILERGVDLSELPAALSMDARQAIKLCLEKDVRKRIRHIGDVKLALGGAFEIASSHRANPDIIAANSSAVARTRLVWRSAFAVSLVISAILAYPALQTFREEVPSALPRPAEVRLDIVTPATYAPTDFALSPDGSQIVYVASGDNGESGLWLRSLASTTAQLLTGTERAFSPFWSHDGRSIGFLTGSALRRLDIGGVPQTLYAVGMIRGGTWGADNTLLFPPGNGGLMRIAATGGAATSVTTLEPQQSAHLNPYFLPDGRRFLFNAVGTPEVSGIYLGDLDGAAPIRLTPADSAGVFHPDGWLLWVQAGTLKAQRLELAQAVLTGIPLSLAEGVATAESFGAMSVSTTGLIAYRTGSAIRTQLTWVDRAGTVLDTLGEPDDALSAPRLSPDSRRVAVSRTVQGNTDIWLLDGTRSSRFTFDAGDDIFPLWSPDGSQVVFRSNRPEGGGLYQKSSTGAGVDTLLHGSDRTVTASSWSADGRFLMYHSSTLETGIDLLALPMTGEPVPFIILQTPFREIRSQISPNGQWIAYNSDESGRDEVYVRAFVDPDVGAETISAAGAQWQISTDGGIYPLWSPDGQELYYLDSAGNMTAVPVTAASGSVDVGAPAVLFPARISGGGTDINQGRQYDVAPDGRFLINRVVEGRADPITLIQNWNPEAAQ